MPEMTEIMGGIDWFDLKFRVGPNHLKPISLNTDLESSDKVQNVPELEYFAWIILKINKFYVVKIVNEFKTIAPNLVLQKRDLSI